MATADRTYRRYRDVDNDDAGKDSLLESPSTENLSKKPRCVSIWTCVLVTVAVVILFLLGFCLGYYVRESFINEDLQNCASYRKDNFNDSKLESVHERVMYFLSRNPKKIGKFVREYGSTDPISHSASERKLKERVEQELEGYIFDYVNTQEYSIIVTYPNPTKPNHLEVKDDKGKLLSNISLVNSPVLEDKKRSEEDAPYEKFPYVAFSLGGSAKGALYYGHYGREVDLLTVKSQNIALEGQILLLRLGINSVAEKLQNAVDAGAGGVLLYWDPADKNPSAPHNRSFIPFASAGSDNETLFTIPSQTISANTANMLLRKMRGELVPSSWQGGLSTKYRYGAGNMSVHLTTYNQKKEMYIHNVVAGLHGYSEPDNYVIVGAPRSSFPGSSTDALASTAMLLQLARSLQYVQRSDEWKPRRGIKLVSWGGAEFSNAGMRQFIKSNMHLLGRRAVAYIDLSELAIGNQTVTATVSPALRNLLRSAARRVPNPLNTESMILEDWETKMSASSMHWSPFKLYTEPVTRNPFLHMVGVPEIHLQFEGHNTSEGSVDVMRDLDSHHHFKYHIAVSRIATLALLKLVDNFVLPYSLRDYADSLHAIVWQTSEGLKECSGDFRDLEPELSLTDHLLQSGAAFDDLLEMFLPKHDVLGVRSVNDVKILFERIFVSKYFGKRFTSQHMIYPSPYKSIQRGEELCHVAMVTEQSNRISQFQERLYMVLNEALRSLKLNE